MMNRIKFLTGTLVILFFTLTYGQYNFEVAFPNLSFSSALDLQNAGDGTNRIFVVERSGRIKVFPNQSSVSSTKIFLDITDRVTSGGETGLLGLAFHPDYESNGYFYVNYTAANPLRTVIARFSVSESNPDSANKNSELILFTYNQPYSNHNGGCVAFGPDGYLYIASGDGGSGGDPQNNAQTLTNLLGKILRVDVDNPASGLNYGIPPDNPFVGSPQGERQEIYAWGLRNPWRFSFDPVTGWLWAADVGQGDWEEIDLIENGKNYGWRCYEGNHPYNLTGCSGGPYVGPIWEYPHTLGFSVTGGYVYRGANVPQLAGKYIYGDYVSTTVWSLEYSGVTPPVNTQITTAPGSIPSFGVDESREFYLVSFNGKIYRFIPTNPLSAPANLVGQTVFTLGVPPEWRIELDWTDSSNDEDGFIVERKVNNSQFEIIASLPANSIYFSDDNVMDTTFYSYRIRAYNSTDTSAYSNYYYVNVGVRTADEPLNLMASSVNNQSVLVEWTNQNFNAYSTKIERKTGEQGVYELIDSVDPGVQTFTDNNVQQGSTYYYRAFAYFENIISPYSNEDSAFVSGPNSVQDNSIPKEFALKQNYPNPFNPDTKIAFAIPKTEFVTLKIYDLLGNEVAALVNGNKPAGFYEVNFDANKLTSGIYFYKLTAGKFVQTRKMILMK